MKEVFWLGMGAAVAVPAALALAAGRRRVAVLTAWFFFPVLVYLALVGWEALTHPGGGRPGAALYGFALVTPIVAPFWLLAFLAGVALGSGARLLVRPLLRPRLRPPPLPPA